MVTTTLTYLRLAILIILFNVLVATIVSVDDVSSPKQRVNSAPGVLGPGFISGSAFQKFANWTWDLRNSPINLKTHDISDGDVLLVNPCTLKMKWLAIYFKTHRPRGRLVLVAHGCDSPFTREQFEVIEPFVMRIHATNAVCGQLCFPKLHPLPIGFPSFRGFGSSRSAPEHELYRSVLLAKLPKEHLLFVNFRVSNNRASREHVDKLFKGQSWVTHVPFGLEPEKCLLETARSKYVLSPQGAGIDCHRIYEAIYLGAIPILLTSPLDYFYADLPVVVVGEWGAVTKAFLEDGYAARYQALDLWVQKNSNWTTPEFWVRANSTGPFGTYYPVTTTEAYDQ
jgi:hypothetical protein